MRGVCWLVEVVLALRPLRRLPSRELAWLRGVRF
jgi:hypothetical protein